MFTLLADAMFAATLAKRGSDIPDRLKDHPDRYVPKGSHREDWHKRQLNSYHNLW